MTKIQNPKPCDLEVPSLKNEAYLGCAAVTKGEAQRKYRTSKETNHMHMDRFFVGAASSRDGIAQGGNRYRGWKPLQRHHVSLCIYGHPWSEIACYESVKE
jgi:hypothetical protein